MRFLERHEVAEQFAGKRVAIVGSAPSVLDNEPGYIDGHDLVVRVNNYKVNSTATGYRTDVFYSFFGTSIRKTAPELSTDGVKLLMCKCPNAHAIDSAWHRQRNKMNGVDFRYIYRNRRHWWFCDTYIPDLDSFLVKFHLLGDRVPTTGFSAILDILSFAPGEVYLTGFDFFMSGIHNVTDHWRPGRADDPIGHAPRRELMWLCQRRHEYPIKCDGRLEREITAIGANA